jgi:hypothetical protein
MNEQEDESSQRVRFENLRFINTILSLPNNEDGPEEGTPDMRGDYEIAQQFRENWKQHDDALWEIEKKRRH